ncbi:Down syndrome cell adhesion molecule -like protein [Halotydeus destructor]|nr:Down syndrome cell adhesion molecule -like protein [Halotydeus destructor]
MSPIFKETFSSGEPRILNEGDKLSLRCVAHGQPLPTVTWSFDGQPFRAEDGHRIRYGDFVSANGYVVSYINVTTIMKEDGGLYGCWASNDLGQINYHQEVRVAGPPFVKIMRNITAISGQKINIRCPVTGYPVTRVSWRKGQTELPMNSRQSVHANNNSITMEVSKVDDGQYSCMAANERGDAHARTFYILVLKTPAISPFRFPVSLIEGNSVIATCSVLEGDAPIDVTWYKDGVHFDPRLLASVHKSEMGDLGSSLIFRNIGQEHSGNYTCRARNTVGVVNYTAEMVVKVPAKWKIEPTDLSAISGDKMSFDCSADGYPAPHVRWKYKSDHNEEYRTISSNYRIQTLENGSLIIHEAQATDKGHYLCEVGNGVGTELSKSVKLIVNLKPYFRQEHLTMSIRKDSPLNVTCEALGDKPIRISWSKDGSAIDLSKYAVSTRETHDAILSQLSSTSLSTRGDSGTYKCTASNGYGRSSRQVRLLVEEEPDSPRNVRIVEILAKSVRVVWDKPYEGNSPLTKYIIVWKLRPDYWTSSFTSEISAATSEIFVTELLPLREYELKVSAINAVGQSKASDSNYFTTDEEPPSLAPLAVRVEPLSSTAVKVKWKAPKHISSFGSITGYYVGYKQLTYKGPTMFKTVKSNDNDLETEVVINGLERSTTYTLSIQAFNSKGTGPSSSDVIVKTLDKDPPSLPKVRLVKMAVDSATLELFSNQNDEVEVYRIFSRSARESEWSSVDYQPNQSQFILSDLRCGSKYQMYAISVNSIGQSEPSETVAFTTKGSAPVAPDKMVFLVVNTSYVMLKLSEWNTICPVTSFEVKIKVRHLNEWSLLANTISPLLSHYLIPGLSPATWYNILVSAHSDAGVTEAEYTFATLDQFGATVAPLLNRAPEDTVAGNGRLIYYLRFLLPIASIFAALVSLVIVFLTIKRKTQAQTNMAAQEDSDCKGTPLSTKSIYESTRKRYDQTLYGSSLHCDPVELHYLETGHAGHTQSRGIIPLNAVNQAQGHYGYDIPIRNQVNELRFKTFDDR